MFIRRFLPSYDCHIILYHAGGPQYDCDNGEFITLDQLCDGVNDCGNELSSDEINVICDSKLFCTHFLHSWLHV